ncbi:MAG TPA: response regulator transcription factor, partial [Anaerolineae bacterium]|nr:response regulator transcription factor [Anaerolineae bacterium]
MPEIDGYEMCRRLREMTDIPVLFLTAKSNIEDKIQGLALGADDYIVKPFNFAELKYRLARCISRTPGGSSRKMEMLFLSDSVTLDCDRHELSLHGNIIGLTPKEFEVLRYLASHPGKVLTTDAILVNVWGTEHIGELDLVKQYIYRLRRKIGAVGNSTLSINTIWGSGYCFELERKP